MRGWRDPKSTLTSTIFLATAFEQDVVVASVRSGWTSGELDKMGLDTVTSPEGASPEQECLADVALRFATATLAEFQEYCMPSRELP